MKMKFGIKEVVATGIGTALFVALSFVTMLFVHHGDAKAEAKKGLEAFEEMDD